MNIRSLLNPYELDSYHHGYRSSESPSPSHLARSAVRDTSTPKRQKIPKDAAIFTDAKPNDPVNFPPYEIVKDEELLKQHRKFQVYPLGSIMRKGARRIPYNSDKKDFMEKTGRDAFEVFHYEFKRPGNEKPFVVMWDYQVGLVRITPFFKCLQFSKTTPAKVLNLNPGLRNISYSITGGALAAQGYWMPYAAAKAVAATFCHEIRWVLTPLFGEDFLTLCVPPDDPSFGKFLIDPAIVRDCTEETEQWRTEGVTYKPYRPEHLKCLPAPSPRPPNSTLTTPRMKFASPPWGSKPAKTKTLYPKPVDQESGYGSGYGTDEGVFSPEVSPRSHGWTSINGSPSSASLPAFSPPQRVLTSVPDGFDEVSHHSKRTLSKVAYSDDGEDDRLRRARSAAVYGLDKSVGRTVGKGALYGYGHDEVDVRPPTSGTVVTVSTSGTDNHDRDDYRYSPRQGYRSRYPHLSEKDFESAEALLLLSRTDARHHKDHRTKRTRRNSKH